MPQITLHHNSMRRPVPSTMRQMPQAAPVTLLALDDSKCCHLCPRLDLVAVISTLVRASSFYSPLSSSLVAHSLWVRCVKCHRYIGNAGKCLTVWNHKMGKILKVKMWKSVFWPSEIMRWGKFRQAKRMIKPRWSWCFRCLVLTMSQAPC
jgi:hypothetical protein